MSKELLGEQFDIHAGANDLVFPHHENEIAQSEAASGKSPFVKYWIHSGLLTVNGQKMSKSLGNFITIPEIKAKRFNFLALRYLFLQAHYRSSQNFTWDLLEAAQNGYINLKKQIKELGQKTGQISQEYKDNFIEKISDDFNTPQALAIIQEVLKSDLKKEDKLATLLDFDKILGLDLDKKDEVEIPKNIMDLVQKREQARKDEEFKKADQIRKQIEEKNYQIEDTETGSKVSPKY